MTKQCIHCGWAQPVELSMNAKNGTPLTMVSCRRCEQRTWYADGEPVLLRDMLRMTNGAADFELETSSRRPPARR